MWNEEVSCMFWEWRALFFVIKLEGKGRCSVFSHDNFTSELQFSTSVRSEPVIKRSLQDTPQSQRKRGSLWPDTESPVMDSRVEQGLSSARAAGLHCLAVIELGMFCWGCECYRQAWALHYYYLHTQLVCSLALFLFCSSKWLGNKMLMTCKAWEIKHKSCKRARPVLIYADVNWNFNNITEILTWPIIWLGHIENTGSLVKPGWFTPVAPINVFFAIVFIGTAATKYEICSKIELIVAFKALEVRKPKSKLIRVFHVLGWSIPMGLIPHSVHAHIHTHRCIHTLTHTQNL